MKVTTLFFTLKNMSNAPNTFRKSKTFFGTLVSPHGLEHYFLFHGRPSAECHSWPVVYPYHVLPLSKKKNLESDPERSCALVSPALSRFLG